VTIAIAHNDTAEGRAALLHAAREATFQHTPLAVLHIVGDLEQDDRAALQREVGEQLSAGGFEGLDWTLHMAPEDTSRAAALVELTEQTGANLLVVGSRRRTPIGKFLLGSTVQRVVLDSPVPVLVVKAPTDEPGDAAAR
jgi:nucleotide-binding universal stress UspA family protein